MKYLTALFIVICTVGQCQSDRSASSILDSRDNKKYSIVRIGNQFWTAGNMAFNSAESYCYNDSVQCDYSGRLYTYEAALSACPAGWRLPSDEDWIALELYLGMSRDDVHKTGPRGSDQGLKLNIGGESGFNAIMCGYRRPDGSYGRLNERTAFWLSTESNSEDAWHRDVRPAVKTIYRSPVTKTYALSVRCIKSEK